MTVENKPQPDDADAPDAVDEATPAEAADDAATVEDTDTEDGEAVPEEAEDETESDDAEESEPEEPPADAEQPEAEDAKAAQAETETDETETDSDETESDEVEPDAVDDEAEQDETAPDEDEESEPAEDDDAEPAASEKPAAAGAVATEAEARTRRARGAHARRVTPRQRLRALVAPQASKTQALIALACLVLGFGLSVQVQSTSSASSFSSLRQSELVSLLDRLTNRQDHLRREITRLQQEKSALDSDNSGAARKAAQDRQDTLGILAGTEPATGPGIELTITDPHTAINAADLLNAVEELRDSGAEVMQIGNVRIGADTYFLDANGGVLVDGQVLTPPYRVLAIGEPHTMGTAMNIPGGVLESLHRSGAEGTVTEKQSISITAVRSP